MADEVRRSATIGWYDRQVPDVRPPQYAGRRYRATVPDTIDLQDMATRAVNGLTGPTDSDADYEIYWRAAFNTNPPVMWHSESDCVQCKFMEALPLMRTISGDGRGAEVEQRWMEVMLQAQGPDGLVYLPKAGRPWCVFQTYGKEPPGDHYCSPWFEGRILGAYAIYHLLTGDDRFKRAAERLVSGMGGLLVHDGAKARFPGRRRGGGLRASRLRLRHGSGRVPARLLPGVAGRCAAADSGGVRAGRDAGAGGQAQRGRGGRLLGHGGPLDAQPVLREPAP